MYAAVSRLFLLLLLHSSSVSTYSSRTCALQLSSTVCASLPDILVCSVSSFGCRSTSGAEPLASGLVCMRVLRSIRQTFFVLVCRLSVYHQPASTSSVVLLRLFSNCKCVFAWM
mmetsp:Transcript_15658/g.40034  ORF Transcript_15658/g.40034 Transcript_15658/m.40034 type:complete len:114 (+) Transcript_15658:1949-2290(+)